MTKNGKAIIGVLEDFLKVRTYDGVTVDDIQEGHNSIISKSISYIKALETENAELRAALANVRDDIGRTAPEVIWRGEQPETTFDYITNIIGDELTYDQWEIKRWEPS